MSLRKSLLFNVLLYVLLNVAFTSFQCSLWLQFFGYFPSPHMWIPTLAYWAIYRRIQEGLFMSYLLVISTVALSSIPLSLFLLLNLLCFALALIVKQRIYWYGPTYLMLICGLISLAFPLFHFLLSWLLEPKPIQDPEILDAILSGLFTALIALPLYYVFVRLDALTHKELPTETGVSTYE